MVFLDEIWKYFLDAAQIKKAYIYIPASEFYLPDDEESINSDTNFAEIPRQFTQGGLLREFIKNSSNKSLKKLARQVDSMTDFELLDHYHKNYSPWFDEDNYYSEWVVEGKEKIIDFAEEWCASNGIKCTRKKRKKFETYSALTAYSN
ncbi:MAG: hypothetical protein K2N72_12640 [Oscillospiraceae bacterium]|nr:hypothetical protein [Oscillospiraceae bacterium]